MGGKGKGKFKFGKGTFNGWKGKYKDWSDPQFYGFDSKGKGYADYHWGMPPKGKGKKGKWGEFEESYGEEGDPSYREEDAQWDQDGHDEDPQFYGFGSKGKGDADWGMPPKGKGKKGKQYSKDSWGEYGGSNGAEGDPGYHEEDPQLDPLEQDGHDDSLDSYDMGEWQDDPPAAKRQRWG